MGGRAAEQPLPLRRHRLSRLRTSPRAATPAPGQLSAASTQRARPASASAPAPRPASLRQPPESRGDSPNRPRPPGAVASSPALRVRPYPRGARQARAAGWARTTPRQERRDPGESSRSGRAAHPPPARPSPESRGRDGPTPAPRPGPGSCGAGARQPAPPGPAEGGGTGPERSRASSRHARPLALRPRLCTSRCLYCSVWKKND